MSEKRFTIDEHSTVNKINDNLTKDFFLIANGFSASQLCDLLNKQDSEIKYLNERIQEVKKDERQLSIDFIDYKMKLIDVLSTIKNTSFDTTAVLMVEIAEEMGVRLE